LHKENEMDKQREEFDSIKLRERYLRENSSMDFEEYIWQAAQATSQTEIKTAWTRGVLVGQEESKLKITELEAKLDTANSKVINLENAVAAMRVTRDEIQKTIIQQDKRYEDAFKEPVAYSIEWNDRIRGSGRILDYHPSNHTTGEISNTNIPLFKKPEGE
jgi:hypothetical protein